MNEIIKQGTLEDGVYKLPEIQLDRKEYLDIAKHLEFLGGKWNGGKKGFIFDRNIKTIEQLLGDHTSTKKDIQLFETPTDLVKKLIKLAEIDCYTIPILEPSAGRGRIIKGIQEVYNRTIDYCEINEINREYLNGIKNTELVGKDFLKINSK